MINSKIVCASLGALATLFAAQASFAQAVSTAPKAAAAPAPGPALPGICVYSNERAIGTSAVGKFVIQRVQTITTQVNAELNAEKTSIETDGKALEGQRATLPQEQFEQKAIGRISAEIEPILKDVYTQRSCALLFDRNALFGANSSMDVTEAVIEKLNAKITQFAFDRERLDQQAVPGQ